MLLNISHTRYRIIYSGKICAKVYIPHLDDLLFSQKLPFSRNQKRVLCVQCPSFRLWCAEESEFAGKLPGSAVPL